MLWDLLLASRAVFTVCSECVEGSAFQAAKQFAVCPSKDQVKWLQ